MTFTEIIESISKKTNTGKDQVHNVLTEFLNTVSAEAFAGNDVKIKGFGKFSMKTSKERVAKVAGKEYNVPAKKVLKFKASKDVEQFNKAAA